MAESYSAEAILSVKDQGFSAAMNNAASKAGALKGSMAGVIKSSALFTVGMKAASAAINSVGSHIGSAVARADTMKQFPEVMSQLGFKASDAEQSIRDLSEGIDGLPTSLDEITKNTQGIALITGDLGGATKTAIALNNAFLSSGSSSADAARGLTQYTQMLSAGKVDMQSWKTLLETMGPALNKVAESFGFTGASAKNDLYKALQSGEITFDELNKKIIALNEGVGGFADLAKTSSTGIATSFTNIGTAVTKGLANVLTAIDSALSFVKGPSGLTGIAGVADIVKSKITGVFNAIAEVDSATGKVTGGALSKIDFKGIFEQVKPYWESLKSVALSLGAVLGKVAGFFLDNAAAISKLIGPLVIALAAFKGFKLVTSIVGPIKTITSSFSKLAGGVLAKLAPQLTLTAAAETEVGASSTASAGAVMRMGVAILAMGAGLALACVGLALLAQSAIALANSGGGAIAVMGGLVLVIAGLAVGAALLGGALTAGAIGFIAFGAAVVLVAAGMYIMAKAVKVAAPGLALLITTAGTVVMGIMRALAAVFQSVGTVIVNVLNQVGTTASTILTSIAEMFTSFGEAVNTVMEGVATVVTSIGDSIAGVLDSVAGIFDSIGNAALNAGKGVQYTAKGIRTLVSMPLADLTATLAATARGLTKIGSASGSVSKAAAAFRTLAATTGQIKGALTPLAASFRSISTAAAAAGKSTGTGFANGIKTGMSAAKSAASSTVKSITSTLKSGASGVKTVGRMISVGFAEGMESCLGRIQSAANKMAEAAEKAVRAKAKVHSPSRLFKEIGGYIGEGFALGIEGTKGLVRRASESMVSIPSGTASRPAMAGESLAGDYFFGGGEFRIEVPLDIDGRQFAKATAEYNQAELNKRETRNNRRKGKA